MVVPTIKIACPNCDRGLRVPANYMGRRVSCKHCEKVFPIPDRVQIPCPKCSQSLNVRAEVMGKVGQCKFCQHTFRIVQPESAPEAKPSDSLASAVSATIAAVPFAFTVEHAASPEPPPATPVAHLPIEIPAPEQPAPPIEPLAPPIAPQRIASEFEAAPSPLITPVSDLAPPSTSTIEQPQESPRGEAWVADAVARHFEDVRSERDHLAEELQVAKTHLDSLRGEVVQRDQLAQELESVRQERDRLLEEMKQMGETLDGLRVDSDRLTELSAAHDAILGERDDLFKEMSDVLSQLEVVRGEARTVEGEDAPGGRGRLIDSIKVLLGEMEEFKTQATAFSRLTSDHEAALAERDRLVDDVRSAVEQLELTRHQVDHGGQLAAELAELRAERDRLREELEDLRARLEAHRADTEQLGRLSLDYEAVCSERDRLQDEARILRGQMEALRSEVLEAQHLRSRVTELERLAAANSVVAVSSGSVPLPGRSTGGTLVPDHEFDALRAQVERLRLDMETARNERDVTVRKLSALQQEREQLVSLRNEAEQRYQTVVTRGNDVFQKAKQHIETLTSRNTELGDEIKRLRQDLTLAQQKVRAIEQEELQRGEAIAALDRDRHVAAVAEPKDAKAAKAAPGQAAAQLRPSDPESLRADLERYLAKVQLREDRPRIDPSSIPDPFAILHTDLALNQLVTEDGDY